MLIEAISHALSLDLSWFIWLVMNSLVWVVLFALAGYVLLGRWVIGGTFIALYVYATVDIANSLGWGFGKGLFFLPVPLFFGLFLFDSFFGKREWHEKGRALLTTFLFFGILVFINVFV